MSSAFRIWLCPGSGFDADFTSFLRILVIHVYSRAEQGIRKRLVSPAVRLINRLVARTNGSAKQQLRRSARLSVLEVAFRASGQRYQGFYLRIRQVPRLTFVASRQQAIREFRIGLVERQGLFALRAANRDLASSDFVGFSPEKNVAHR